MNKEKSISANRPEPTESSVNDINKSNPNISDELSKDVKKSKRTRCIIIISIVAAVVIAAVLVVIIIATKGKEKKSGGNKINNPPGNDSNPDPTKSPEIPPTSAQMIQIPHQKTQMSLFLLLLQIINLLMTLLSLQKKQINLVLVDQLNQEHQNLSQLQSLFLLLIQFLKKSHFHLNIISLLKKIV